MATAPAALSSTPPAGTRKAQPRHDHRHRGRRVNSESIRQDRLAGPLAGRGRGGQARRLNGTARSRRPEPFRTHSQALCCPPSIVRTPRTAYRTLRSRPVNVNGRRRRRVTGPVVPAATRPPPGCTAAGRAAGSAGPARTRPPRAPPGTRPKSPAAARPPPNRSRNSASRASNSSRDAITALCRDVHAPICDDTGRLWKYARPRPASPLPPPRRPAPAAPAASSRTPATPAGSRPAPAPCGWRGWSRTRTPGASNPLSSTTRPAGRPAASAVASVIAVGSGTPAAPASANHRRNCSTGSPAASASSNSPARYSFRWSAGAACESDIPAIVRRRRGMSTRPIRPPPGRQGPPHPSVTPQSKTGTALRRRRTPATAR